MADRKLPSNLVALRAAREAAIATLSDAFAHDVIEVEEFERRVTLAHKAASLSEVSQTVLDLTMQEPSVALVPALPSSPVLVNVRESDSVMAIFGGVERHGAWTPPRRLRAAAVMGGMVLDFREALLGPGVTEVSVTALFGGAQIIVPPGLSVEVSGTAIMGGFGHIERAPTQPDPDWPTLRVRGLAFMGGVAVETRLSGESETDAHRRRHRDRHALGSASETRRLPEKAGR